MASALVKKEPSVHEYDNYEESFGKDDEEEEEEVNDFYQHDSKLRIAKPSIQNGSEAFPSTISRTLDVVND
jgi:hypothetical protein